MRMRELPDVAGLSDHQVRGKACVWCGIILAPDTAVDLGPRRIRILDRHVTTYPRGCRACVAEHLPAAQQAHAAGCEQCADAPDVCETARTLRRLVELAVSR